MDRELIKLIYEIESNIDKEKGWIEIADTICAEDEDIVLKMSLIIDELKKINCNTYKSYELLLSKMQDF